MSVLRLFFFLGYGDRRFVFVARVRDRQVRNILTVVATKLDCNVFVDGAGVRLLFRDAKLGQQVEDLVRLDLQLPRQLINSDLSHR
jgi:hypothetical protein